MLFSYHLFFFFILVPFSLFSSCHVILHKRDPRACFGWLITCLVFVGIGPILYWLFGINRIRSYAQKLHRLGYWNHRTETGRVNWEFKLSSEKINLPPNLAGIFRVSEKVNRHPLMLGNKIETLCNGEEAYPAMLQAIEEAKDFIYLCTYIFDTDDIGKLFIKALSDAHKRGVKVWVLIDAFGEKYHSPPAGRVLAEEGIRVGRFLPLSFSINSLHFNMRNHRKLLVVDGKKGFTGGMNIRRWKAQINSYEVSYTDLHFKVEGPVILELQEVFLEDWFFATGESLSWFEYAYDPLPGNTNCRVISGGPNEDAEKINWILLGVLACAQERIQIMTPYFIPDRVMISALNTAALRGVRVEVILPEKNNLPFIGWANRALLWEMLQNGIRFYYQPAPFAHSKLMVADDSYALIGSSNWDSRSFRLNFELGTLKFLTHPLHDPWGGILIWSSPIPKKSFWKR